MMRARVQYVLAIGNYLNADSNARGGAYGFKLDTLKKLSLVKSSDGKSTLLDYLAHAAYEEGKSRGLARLPTDLQPVSSVRTESLDAVCGRGCVRPCVFVSIRTTCIIAHAAYPTSMRACFFEHSLLYIAADG
ncbi:MAG: hypothetical protein EOO65_05920 [Methanosarcinales archaeon]|nr:MAG: hypothetical protein EOO65_05920 [Methanosarcinales archaeon]